MLHTTLQTTFVANYIYICMRETFEAIEWLLVINCFFSHPTYADVRLFYTISFRRTKLRSLSSGNRDGTPSGFA